MIHQQSFAALAAGYSSGRFSPTEVVESTLRHAERIQPKLNPFALIDRERALRAALESQARWRNNAPLGPLDGMPITVKDSASVKGWPSQRGSLATSTEPLSQSAVFVERLLSAGAILIGKTRAPEFNWKAVTDSPGFGVTRNPWNPALTPGGSSGGCATAVAAGVTRISIGSDAGGSVRIPAAFTGILGLKPTHGLIPITPPASHFSGVAHLGPLGVHSRDMLDTLKIISGHDNADWFASHALAPQDSSSQNLIGRLRVGVLSRTQGEHDEPMMQSAISQFIARLLQDGASVEDVNLDVRAISAVGESLYRIGCLTSLRAVPRESQHLLEPAFVEFCRAAEDIHLHTYLDLMRSRDRFGELAGKLFDCIDLLVLPCVPMAAFTVGQNSPEGYDPKNWFSWNPYTPVFNVLQCPALSYPVWVADSQMPAAVQLVANRYQDRLLLDIAAWAKRYFPVKIAPDFG